MSTNRGDARGLARRREDPDPARAHPRAQRYPLVGTELDPDGDQVWFRIPIAGPLLSSTTYYECHRTGNCYRQSEIDRPQAEIKALTDVEQIQAAGAEVTATGGSRPSCSPAISALDPCSTGRAVAGVALRRRTRVQGSRGRGRRNTRSSLGLSRECTGRMSTVRVVDAGAADTRTAKSTPGGRRRLPAGS